MNQPPYQLAEMFHGVAISHQLQVGLKLDRPEVKKLLAQMEGCGSELAGQAQLRALLERKDWLLVHISAESIDWVRRQGVRIGIVASKPAPARKAKLSPLQKWQRANRQGRAF